MIGVLDRLSSVFLVWPHRRHGRLALSVLAASAALSVGGCSFFDRLENVGAEPKLSEISLDRVGGGGRGYRTVSVPMPQRSAAASANSLWRSGDRAFLKAQRAEAVGDIVTVLISINDRADIENATQRRRSADEDAALSGFFGVETLLPKIFPDGVSADALADFSSGSASRGEGRIERSEAIELTLAAIVTDVLPNGNLMIEGRQEFRVNFEVRELQIVGVVRPADIKADNTIRHTQIAEARLSYGGRGHISDVQQQRYGQQVYDILMPF